jgi:multidrug efflux pump subunit AcrA (membrane-fusion protein)
MKKKNIIIAVIMVILVGWRIATRGSNTTTVPTQTVEVSYGEIQNTIQLNGETKLVNNQKLTFGQAGKVTNIHVKVGDVVTKGQLLAEIDKTDIQGDINSQSLQVKQNQISYQKLFDKTNPSDITKLKNTVEENNQNLIILQGEYESMLLEKKNKITDLENSLKESEKNKNNLTQKLQDYSGELDYLTISNDKTLNDTTVTNKNLIDNINLQASSVQQDAKEILLFTDKFLVIDDRSSPYLNNAWIGAKDFFSKSNAEASYMESKTLLGSFSSSTDVVKNLENTKKLLQALVSLVNNSSDLLSDSVTQGDMTESILSSWKSQLSSYNSKLTSSISSANNYEKQFLSQEDGTSINLSTNNSLNQKEQQLSSNELELLKIQNQITANKNTLLQTNKDYDLKLTQKQNDLKNYASNQLYYTQLLNETLWGPNASDIASSSISIDMARASLSKTANKMSDYEIRAQFDGEISSIDFNVGDQISSAEWITLINSDLYQIISNVDQIDIVKIRLNQEVNIKLDAYDDVISGAITEISGTPETSNGVVTYQIKVTIPKLERVVYDGMTAQMTVILEDEQGLLIPTAAISQSGSQTRVNKSVNDKWILTPVVVGTSTADKSQIISGLKAGDTIATSAVEYKKSAWSSSLFTLPAGGGAGTRGTKTVGGAGGFTR